MKRSLLVLFLSFLAIGAQAQLEQAVKKIFAGDTITNGHVPLKRDSDSIHLANMQKSLEEARLNEANMRMEMEQMKLQMLLPTPSSMYSSGSVSTLCVSSLREYR